MQTLKRRLSWGSQKSNSSTGSRPPVADGECKLTLDGNTLTLDKEGRWHLDQSTVGNYEAEIERLQQHVHKLEREKRELKEKYLREHGEKLMYEFKNSLLMELLATSQLDSNRNYEAYQKESLRTEALKWELGKWLVSGEKQK